MDTESISLTELCDAYQIEPSLLEAFAEAGLIQPERRADALYLAVDELPELESLLRLALELGIGPESLDLVRHLRRQVVTLQATVTSLRYRLERVESRHQHRWSDALPH